MREKTLYFLFTDTGTYLSKAINYCTKQSLNHVSIGFDPELKEVYSFGRTHPRNPFNGGFVKEDIRSDFLKDANRSEEHTSELQSRGHLVCRLLLATKKSTNMQGRSMR